MFGISESFSEIFFILLRTLVIFWLLSKTVMLVLGSSLGSLTVWMIMSSQKVIILLLFMSVDFIELNVLIRFHL